MRVCVRKKPQNNLRVTYFAQALSQRKGVLQKAFLKDELQRKLNLARISHSPENLPHAGRQRIATRRGPGAGNAGICCFRTGDEIEDLLAVLSIARHIEVSAIEEIEYLGTKLETALLVNAEVFDDREIDALEVRPRQNVSSGVATKPGHGRRECRGIEPKVRGWSARRGQADSRKQIGSPGIVIRAVLVRIAQEENTERHAGGKRDDCIELPTCCQQTAHAFHILTERQIVRRIGYEAVPHIEV